MAKSPFRRGETMTRAEKKVINTMLPYPRTKGRAYYAWVAEGNRIGGVINRAVENGTIGPLEGSVAPPPIAETVASIKRSLASGRTVMSSALTLRALLAPDDAVDAWTRVGQNDYVVSTSAGALAAYEDWVTTEKSGLAAVAVPDGLDKIDVRTMLGFHRTVVDGEFHDEVRSYLMPQESDDEQSAEVPQSDEG